MSPISPPELVASIIFAIAVLHTFATGIFARLAEAQPRHAGLWHLLAEIEVVFGFWALVLFAALFWLSGKEPAISYLEGRNFTEPLFVFAIMVIAASRPILESVMLIVRQIARLLPIAAPIGAYFLFEIKSYFVKAGK